MVIYNCEKIKMLVDKALEDKVNSLIINKKLNENFQNLLIGT